MPKNFHNFQIFGDSSTRLGGERWPECIRLQFILYGPQATRPILVGIKAGLYILVIFQHPGGWKNLQKFENCGNFWATKVYVTFQRKLNFDEKVP